VHRLACAILAGLGLLACNAPPCLTAQTYTPPTAQQVNAQVKDILIGQNSYGWDPVYQGILINWWQANPNQVNCNGADVCDTQPNSTQHDSTNDIRDLQHLYWYTYRNPSDTSFSAAIQDIAGTTKSEWGTTSLDKGWVYGILLRLYEYAPTPAERAYWRNVIVTYWVPTNYNNLDSALHVQINYNVGNCDCGSSTIYLAQSFRVPYALEIGADLIDAGTRFNNPQWIAAGYQSVQSVVNLAFIPQYGLTGRIFLISDPKYTGTNYLWDTESQPQDNSEMMEALVRAAAIVNTTTLVSNSSTIASYLNSLAAQIMNANLTAGHLHDATYGGYFESFYVAKNFDGTAAGTTDTSDKEGRQLSLLGSAHLYDLFNQSTEFANVEAEMLRLNMQPYTPATAGVNGMVLPNTVMGTPPTVNGYPASTLGYTFETNGNFSLWYASGVYQDWVSAEQNNLAMLGMQEWLSSPLTTTTTLSASSLNIIIGGSVTLTAVVNGSNSTAATGNVFFYDGSASLGGGLLNSTGQAQLTLSTLAVGSHSITAQYAGDTDFYSLSTSAPTTITVGGNATTTTLTATPNPVTQGSSITFTSNVSSSATGTPTGTVTFYDSGTAIGSGTLAAHIASFSTSSLSVGQHTVTAMYSGDATFAASSSTSVSVTVNGAPTATQTALTATPTSGTVGTSVAIAVTVSNNSSGYLAATGTVNILDGTTSLGVVPLTNGAASLTVSTFAVGSHTLTALYSGDTTHTASTSSATYVTITATPVATTTTLSSSATTAQEGVGITFSSTVSSTANGTPSGIVDFFDGINILESRALGTNGTASVSISTLNAGSHTISAGYEGDATHNPSISPALAILITAVPAASAVALTASGSPIVFGVNETLSLQVSSTANGTPSGGVTILDGSTPLATLTLDSNGDAALSTSTLAVGSHTLTATYTGDSGHNPASSSAIVVIVQTIATNASLSASATSLASGALLTLTANITSSSSIVATGNIVFLEGSTSLGSASLSGSGVATFNTAALSVGTHALTAVYAGDSTHGGSTSNVVSVIVGTPAFTLSATPASVTATSSTEAVVQITMTPSFGFSQTVTLSVSGLPANASARFASSTLTPGSNGAGAVTNVSIAIDGQTAATHIGAHPLQHDGIFLALTLGLGLVDLRRRMLRHVRMLSLAIAMTAGWLSLVLFTGCGSGGSANNNRPSTPVTPPGSYTITISATTSQTQTANFTLVVQ